MSSPGNFANNQRWNRWVGKVVFSLVFCFA
jgi:hypothetical protein